MKTVLEEIGSHLTRLAWSVECQWVALIDVVSPSENFSRSQWGGVAGQPEQAFGAEPVLSRLPGRWQGAAGIEARGCACG